MSSKITKTPSHPKSQTQKIISKNEWGPKAWHILHSFSIHPPSDITNDQKHDYFLFYKTFYYVIPCKICKIHYKDMFELFEPLVEKDITRHNLKKWVWKIHNIVNRRLNKRVIDYKKAMKIQSKIRNNDIFFFMNHFFVNIDNINCCISDFDHIYHFFFVFAKLYPDLEIQQKLYPLVLSDEYSNISSPKELKEWYIHNYKKWQH